ncbi:MAG: hypothetical protein IT165_12745 [Bryobacterales bacterium]|nr:hypothetical protein [Bryobacterales bacterium]
MALSKIHLSKNIPMLGSLFNKSRSRAEINRENSQKSTGPKTEAGKAASSRNALKEGFSASFAIVAPEDGQCYDEFLAGLRAELQPQGVQEEDLFRRISLASWNIRRIEKLTFALYEETGADPLASDDSAVVSKLERYTRHQTLNERSYYRGIKQLRLLQNSRPSESDPPQPVSEPATEQSHPPAGDAASAPIGPPETENSKKDKTKPAECPAKPPQNEPANQAHPDPEPDQPDFSPNHLLLIVK